MPAHTDFPSYSVSLIHPLNSLHFYLLKEYSVSSRCRGALSVGGEGTSGCKLDLSKERKESASQELAKGFKGSFCKITRLGFS